MSAPRKSLCRRCGGEGVIHTQGLVDPSARWDTKPCERCDGDGYEPVQRKDAQGAAA